VRILLIGVACAALLQASGQEAGKEAGKEPGQEPGKEAIDTLHLTVATSVTAAARPGAAHTLVVEIAPKPKMHVYAPAEKEGIPVSLTLDPKPTFKTSPPQFPPPEKYYFEPLKLTQLVFSKPFRIRQPIVLTNSPSSAPLTIEGSLRYQACDDRVCYIPKTIRLLWRISPPAAK
jgi:DsbC/DsbD-like thiol-disulfide interchange protein